MPLSKLVFKPGINREGTNYSNEGGWHDGDKIRFRYGYVEKLGGWEKATTETYDGTPRILKDFVTLSSQSLLMIGTEKKVYLEESGTLYDITPYRRTVTFPHEFAENGVEGTGAVGSPSVLIGGTAEDNVAAPKGIAAYGIAGYIGNIILQQNVPFGFPIEGQVGSVTVSVSPVDVSVGGTSGIRIGISPSIQATGSVGFVTVDAEVVEEE